MKLFKFLYPLLLILFTIYVLLDTFVISKIYMKEEQNSNSKEVEKGEVIYNDSLYKDDNIKIEIKKYRKNDTTIYVADVLLNDFSYLKKGFANSSYGKNVTSKTSQIADNVSAILAVNGDYYGVREKGYVLKDGVIYRNTQSNNQEDLVIYEDGTFEIINEDDISLEKLKENGAYNILSFGPSLIQNSNISVDTNSEVDKAMASNPRTAIGKIDNNHYVFVVSDGRTSESKGLSLYELASFMKSLKCTIAYNLDGGGSSTMYFNGNVVNNTTSNGRSNERSVSDIVYIGY